MVWKRSVLQGNHLAISFQRDCCGHCPRRMNIMKGMAGITPPPFIWTLDYKTFHCFLVSIDNTASNPTLPHIPQNSQCKCTLGLLQLLGTLPNLPTASTSNKSISIASCTTQHTQ